MKQIFKLYQFVGKYKWRMAMLAVTTIVGVGLETIRPYWLKMILDSAEAGGGGLAAYLILFGVSVIGGNLVSALAFQISDMVLAPVSREVKEAVFRKILELDFAYHTEKSTGSLISVFRRGDGAVFNVFFNINQELFRVLINLTVTLVFLTMADPTMALIMVIMLGLNLGWIVWLVKKNVSKRSEFNQADDEVSGVIADSMINYETVKFFAAENNEKGRLANKLDVWVKKFWAYSYTFRMMDVTIGTTSGLGMMVILAMAVGKVGTSFSYGDLVMVVGFITGFYYEFFNLFFRIREIAKGISDLEKYLEILDLETKVKDPKKEIRPTRVRGKIEFLRIGFVYPKNKERVLEGINLTISPGEKVALVGRSGTGKTTLVKLLLRFYDIKEGEIKIDGVDIRKMSKGFLRSLTGVVPQEPIMFNNSIRFNLGYGKTGASQKELEEAARKANILEFIESLPEKWETQVGERGIKLSGGQKQRLAIARALLTEPKILIFDEATSNLDSESEKMIQEALMEAGKNRTVIVIAHRLSTIRQSDKIVVLANGSVAEIGRHEELLMKNGIYKRLWTLQSKGRPVEKDTEGLINKVEEIAVV